MTDAASDPDIRAAGLLWEQLAASAWSQYLTHGRGVLLIDQVELREAAADGGNADLHPTFFPQVNIPRGDDFRLVLAQYDPARQVMLLVRTPEGSEKLLALECAGDERPAPEACYLRRQRDLAASRPGQNPIGDDTAPGRS